jgi:hypothetical protein
VLAGNPWMPFDWGHFRTEETHHPPALVR